MTGNKMSELGDDSDCFTAFLTNVIYMKFPRKVRINENTKILREDKGDREGIPHTHPIP